MLHQVPGSLRMGRRRKRNHSGKLQCKPVHTTRETKNDDELYRCRNEHHHHRNNSHDTRFLPFFYFHSILLNFLYFSSFKLLLLFHIFFFFFSSIYMIKTFEAGIYTRVLIFTKKRAGPLLNSATL